MSCAIVDGLWFFERGGLHDAHVTAVRLIENTIEISIDDEWVNERGLSKPNHQMAPCTLKFIEAAVITGKIRQTDGGWINEVLREAEGHYRFMFTDRPPVVLKADRVICEMLARPGAATA